MISKVKQEIAKLKENFSIFERIDRVEEELDKILKWKKSFNS